MHDVFLTIEESLRAMIPSVVVIWRNDCDTAYLQSIRSPEGSQRCLGWLQESSKMDSTELEIAQVVQDSVNEGALV